MISSLHNKNSSFVLGFLIIMSTCFLCSCSKPETVHDVHDNNYPLKIYGQVVEKSPEKIVTLSPAVTDAILTLGYGDRIVAVSDECDFLINGGKTATVGQTLSPDIDKIVKSGAELVISSSGLDKQSVSTLRKNGIKLLTIEPVTDYDSFDAFYTSLAQIMDGKENGKDKAKEAINKFQNELDKVKHDFMPKGQTKSYIIMQSLNGDILTPDTAAGKIAGHIVGINMGEQCTNSKMDIDTLKNTDPDVIICPKGLRKKILNDERLEKLVAVQNDSIIECDLSSFERLSISSTEEIKEITTKMYPKGFSTGTNTDSDFNEEDN